MNLVAALTVKKSGMNGGFQANDLVNFNGGK
jgi:hypothetical protein